MKHTYEVAVTWEGTAGRAQAATARLHPPLRSGPKMTHLRHWAAFKKVHDLT